MVEDTRRSPTPAHKKNEGQIDARSLMESLAPKMLEWLKTSLAALGLDGAAVKGKEANAHPAKNKGKKGQKGKTTIPNTPNVPIPTPGKLDAGKGGLLPTTVPNKKLWNEVAGGNAGRSAPPPQPDIRQGPADLRTSRALRLGRKSEARRRGPKRRPPPRPRPKGGRDVEESRTPPGRHPRRELPRNLHPPERTGAEAKELLSRRPRRVNSRGRQQLR